MASHFEVRFGAMDWYARADRCLEDCEPFVPPAIERQARWPSDFCLCLNQATVRNSTEQSPWAEAPHYPTGGANRSRNILYDQYEMILLLFHASLQINP